MPLANAWWEPKNLWNSWNNYWTNAYHHFRDDDRPLASRTVYDWTLNPVAEKIIRGAGQTEGSLARANKPTPLTPQKALPPGSGTGELLRPPGYVPPANPLDVLKQYNPTGQVTPNSPVGPDITFQDYLAEAGLNFDPIQDISGRVGAAYNPIIEYLKNQVPYWENRETTLNNRLAPIYQGMEQSTMDSARFMQNLGRTSGADAQARAQAMLGDIRGTGQATTEGFTNELARLGISDAAGQNVDKMGNITGTNLARGVNQGLTNANYVQAQADNWAGYEASRAPLARAAQANATQDLAMRIDDLINATQGKVAEAQTSQAGAIAQYLRDLQGMQLQQQGQENSLRAGALGDYYSLLQRYAEMQAQAETDAQKNGGQGEAGSLQGPAGAFSEYTDYLKARHLPGGPAAIAGWNEAEANRQAGLATSWATGLIEQIVQDMNQNEQGIQDINLPYIYDFYRRMDEANPNINLSPEDRAYLIQAMLAHGMFGPNFTAKNAYP